MPSNSSEEIVGIAGADLSGDIYKLVKFDGAAGEAIVLQDTTTAIDTLGVLNNEPTTGQDAHIGYSGFFKVYCGAVLEPFDLVASDVNGRVVPATTGNAIVGQYIPEPILTGMPDSVAGGDPQLVRVFFFGNKSNLAA